MSVTGQSVILTALLIYFGRATLSSTYSYFGVDSSLLSLSSTDYLVRVPSQAFYPLLRTGLVVLVVVTVVVAVSRWLRANRSSKLSRRLPTIIATVGTAVLLVGAAMTFTTLNFSLYPPYRLVTLAAGALIVAVAVWFRSSVRAENTTSIAWELGVLGTIAVLSLFGAWALYAVDVGTDSARQIARELASRPAVSVYSKERLALAGPGVSVVALPSGGRYAVRYSGLRLLARTSDGALYLLPKQWRHGVDPVYVLKDDENTRLEIIATPEAAPS